MQTGEQADTMEEKEGGKTDERGEQAEEEPPGASFLRPGNSGKTGKTPKQASRGSTVVGRARGIPESYARNAKEIRISTEAHREAEALVKKLFGNDCTMRIAKSDVDSMNGLHDSSTKTIWLNERVFGKPVTLRVTIFHESVHAMISSWLGQVKKSAAFSATFGDYPISAAYDDLISINPDVSDKLEKVRVIIARHYYGLNYKAFDLPAPSTDRATRWAQAETALEHNADFREYIKNEVFAFLASESLVAADPDSAQKITSTGNAVRDYLSYTGMNTLKE